MRMQNSNEVPGFCTKHPRKKACNVVPKHSCGGGGEIPARGVFAAGREVVGEHEGITCDQFEARARNGGGRRRIIGV